MRKLLIARICIPLLFCVPAKAQQSGNYQSETIEAKTRSRDASGSPVFSDWKPFETRLVANIRDFKPAPVELNKYGSSKSIKSKKTGFFRAEKINNRWWIIDPEGYAGLNIAMNSVNTGNSERNKEAYAQKFTNNTDWIQKTKTQLHDLGFNGTGSWSNHGAVIKANDQSKKPLSYTINWNFMSSYGKKRGGTYSVPGHTGYPGNVIFVFDPEFEKFCDEHAKQLATYKDDPNLFGYFSDNEMPFSLKNLEGYLNLKNKEDHGYLAAKKWLDERNITQDQITDKDRAEFLAFAADKYFSIVSNAIKKHDPNHMYLGSRLYSSEKNVPAFMKTVGKYVDIVSINYYGVWTPNSKMLSNWEKWSGKPFIITEYYTKGMDSGLPNISGAGWQVKTQEDRGKFYQNYCLALLESKTCVGWHWFKYQDNDPSNSKAEASNQDANKGIVDNDYNLYIPLADKMRELNQNYIQLINYLDNINK